METTIHLSGDEDLKIRKSPDGSVQIELWNPMDILRAHEATANKKCLCDGLTSGCSSCPPSNVLWPQARFSRYIDKPSARLIASALLAAASNR